MTLVSHYSIAFKDSAIFTFFSLKYMNTSTIMANTMVRVPKLLEWYDYFYDEVNEQKVEEIQKKIESTH